MSHYFVEQVTWLTEMHRQVFAVEPEIVDSLSDVDTTSSSPTDGQVLTWNQSSSNWVPDSLPNDLPVGGTTGQIFEMMLQTLTYDGIPAVHSALKTFRSVLQEKGMWPLESE